MTKKEIIKKRIIIPMYYMYSEYNNDIIVDDESMREEFENKLKDLLIMVGEYNYKVNK